jgi:hypothetical protein
LSLAASPNLTDLNFLCESGSLISTVGTPVSLVGSSTTLACQPASIVPSEFEPHTAPMPVPLPAPRVPSGFPSACHPGTLCAPDHHSWWSDRLPGRSDGPPIQRLAVRLPPIQRLAVRPPGGPPPCQLLRQAWVHHHAPSRHRRSPTPIIHDNLRHRRPRLHLTARPRPYP